ncbi:MAG: PIN domain-containing protein [Ruegeria sp.]
MRSSFPGHFEYNPNQVKTIWADAKIVLDANVLLNMYRYSDDARNEFLDLLKDNRKKCWLPEQCGFEFLNNRDNVIRAQAKAYEDTTKAIGELKKEFSGSTRHPFLTKDSFAKLEEVIDTITSELDTNRETQEKRIQEDEIKEAVADIFDGLVGPSVPVGELDAILKTASSRFENKVPPGYMDAKKHPDPKSDADKRSNCGDYLFWYQTLEMAKEEKVPVILVTDEKKEDWWVESSGQIVGPRPELVAEFQTETGQKILIYRANTFLRLAKEYLDANVSTETIDEIRREQDTRRDDQVDPTQVRKFTDRLRAQIYGTPPSPSLISGAVLDKQLSNWHGFSPSYKKILGSNDYSVRTKMREIRNELEEIRRLRSEAEAQGDDEASADYLVYEQYLLNRHAQFVEQLHAKHGDSSE